MAVEPSVIVQVPHGSAIEQQLRDRPPPSLDAEDVIVETGRTDAAGGLDESAGDVVLALPAPEELRRQSTELARVLDQAGPGTAPLVVVLEAGEELREEEVAPLIEAARG